MSPKTQQDPTRGDHQGADRAAPAADSHSPDAPLFDQPLVSIDVVPVWVDGTRIMYGLGIRQNPPFAGELALPGVLMGHERSVEAAERALSSKVGIVPEAVRHLTDIGVFDSRERDPRGPTLSIAKLAVLAPEAAAAACEAGSLHRAGWGPEDPAFGLPFDHDTIVDRAHRHLAGSFWTDAALLRSLLGGTFTTKTVTGVYRELSGDDGVHPSNIRRRLESIDGLELGSSTVTQGRGRPTSVWTWED